MPETHARRLPSAQGLAARRLVRRARQAALSTTMASAERGAGTPFASLVTVATDQAGAPVLLLSRLAEHTRNLMADPRAALLITDPTHAHENPQEDARVTLMGRLVPDPTPALRTRFLARHPYAEMYADFADFGFFRMSVHRAHMVGGFGVAGWVDDPAALTVPAGVAEPLAAEEAALCLRLSTTRADDLIRIAGPGAWQVAALDADGLDIVPTGHDGRGPVMRIPFPESLAGPDGLDAAFLALVAGVP